MAIFHWISTLTQAIMRRFAGRYRPERHYARGGAGDQTKPEPERRLTPQKKAPENRSLLIRRRFRIRCSGLAVGLGRFTDEAPERLEGLPGKFAVKFADFLRLGHRALVGPFHEFGLNFHRLVERADNSSNDFRV